MTDSRPSGLAAAVNLESADWGESKFFRALGYYFSLTTSDGRLDNYIESVIGRFRVDPDPAEDHSPPTPGRPPRYELLDGETAGDGRFRLYFNNVVISSSLNASDVFDHLYWHINAEAARNTGEFVLIHSGAVGTPSDRGVLIPGASGAGKSTLVSGLLHAGFTYYSDEAAAIDPIERMLYSYPKAITLKDGTVFDTYPDLPAAETSDDFNRGNKYIVPTQIRSDIEGRPTQVGHILVSRFEPGASTAIESISRAEAAMALGRSVMNITRYKSRLLPLLADLVAEAQCLSLVTGDLRSAVDAVVAATAD